MSARHAILQAALDAVRSEGYGGLTVEQIARRAGVGKQTIYRWWRTKADVVLEALLEDAVRAVAPKPTGNPHEDVRRFLRATFRRLQTTGGIVAALMAVAQIDVCFREAFRERFLDHRRAALRHVVVAAAPPDADSSVLVDCLYGAMWYRLLDGHGPLDDRFADALVVTLLGEGVMDSERQ